MQKTIWILGCFFKNVLFYKKKKKQHMSPKTMAALPKSPAGGRRSSSGTSLRPVLPFTLDDENAIDDEELESGHLGREPPSGEFPAGASVDEVEYAYGYVFMDTGFLFLF